LSKGRLEAERASLRDIRRYSNRVKLSAKRYLSPLKATDFWAMVADYVRLAHASKQFDSIVSCLAQTDHFKR
jgi:hypothetical protein